MQYPARHYFCAKKISAINKGALKSEAGFTLLEILIAVTVLAFIMTIIYSSFFAISQSEKRVSLSTEVEIKARNLMEMLMRDLSSAVIPRDGTEKKEGTLNYGLYCTQTEKGQKLDFTASLSDSANVIDARLREVGYFLVANERGSYDLVKRIDLTPDDDIQQGGRDLLLMKDLASLAFQFKKNKGDWMDLWDGKERPQAIRITLTLLNDDENEEEFITELPLYGGKVF
ncbi:MAG: prepilin-type N-terminal cleavage/methylation domain-containing protein [Deltaproteobacteria bacterium]|nr:prepilin-type N-terminal cleavage/methylation domain-containing protein [Deltaproteobacteria bacterium]